MTTIFIILGVIVLTVAFVLCFLLGTIINIVGAIKKAVHKRSKSTSSTPTTLTTVEEVNERIFELITHDFEKNGWNKWDEATHRKPGQLDRLRRGTEENSNIILMQYNPLKGIAKFKGSSGRYYLTSGERCSCPDYRKRLLPCKHMYKLATLLPNYEEELQPDDSFKSSISHDNVFGGLYFSIVGRNQTPVKEFITAHGGIYGNYYMSEESAVVLASDMMTNKRTEAIAKDYEIMTFEDLQNLFDIFVD